jgi:hypothetical protein
VKCVGVGRSEHAPAPSVGANGDGTVFEIKNTGTAAAPIYASAPTTLVSFNGSNGQNPYAGLIANANGDLFGTSGSPLLMALILCSHRSLRSSPPPSRRSPSKAELSVDWEPIQPNPRRIAGEQIRRRGDGCF